MNRIFRNDDNSDEQCTPSIDDFIDDDKAFKPGTIEAVKAFARTKPWRGTVAERSSKFSALHAALCEIYGSEQMLIINVPEKERGAGGSLASKANRRKMVLTGRLSVVTYLHLFAKMATKSNGLYAFRWSLSLFQRCFPRSYANCEARGPYLTR